MILKRSTEKIKNKYSYVLGAILLLVGTALPLFQIGVANALLVSSRSITMSTSVPGVTANYAVSFTPKTTANVGGIVIAFCDNDPIIGDVCSTSAGSVVLSSATLTSASGDISGFTKSGSSSATTFIVTDGTPTAESSSSPITFTITGVTNPNYASCTPQSPNCSFYARIETFDTASDANAWTAAGTTGLVDSGGIALSTNQQITITSKVQEVLVFCVFTSGTCSAGGSGVQLGNTNGVLSSSNSYTNVATQYSIQTNASLGASIVAQSPHSLEDSGSDIIESSGLSGMGAAAATAYISNPGHPQFGFCTFENATFSGLTPVAPYNNGTCSSVTSGASDDAGASFAFNIADLSGAGDQIATAVAGPTTFGTVAFIGNISNSNVAGIYTTTMTFIATGTY